MKIGVIGTGYVGLVSGLCLAEKGHSVTCFDLRKEVIDSLNRGEPHIYEKGLQEMLTRNILNGQFTSKMASVDALEGFEVIILAVGTPSSEGKIDLSQIGGACELVGSYIKITDKFVSVIVKSTCLPTTTDTFVKNILERTSGKSFGAFGLGMNPEFLREGEAIEDFMFPDRVVLGFEDSITLERLREIYTYWSCEKFEVNTRTAEMIKYSNNYLLALQISATNEIANISAVVGGINAMDVMHGVHLDKRWNPIVNGQRTDPKILTYLIPGCGFGGSCFPKDVQALRTFAETIGIQPNLLQAVLDINEAQPHQVVKGIKRHIPNLKGKIALVLGVAFKPDTDDIRESASLKIIEDLLTEGADVRIHDPIAIVNAKKYFVNEPVEFIDNWKSSIVNADIIILATKWDEYKDLLNLKNHLVGKVLFDARMVFKSSDFNEATYLTIGFN